MINIQNTDDNECLKWCLVKYLHQADDHQVRIRKVDKDFSRELNFKGAKSPGKIRDIHKSGKKNCISISVFDCENKIKYPIYVSRNAFKRHDDLLLKKNGLIKDFSTFMYDHTLHRGRMLFCCYCLQHFKVKEILKFNLNHSFKNNAQKRIKMPKKG